MTQYAFGCLLPLNDTMSVVDSPLWPCKNAGSQSDVCKPTGTTDFLGWQYGSQTRFVSPRGSAQLREMRHFLLCAAAGQMIRGDDC